MKVTTAALLVTCVVAGSVVDGQQEKPITEATVVAIQAWVDAVRSHTPGRADVAVVTVAALSYPDREELNAGIRLFLKTLHSKSNATPGRGPAGRIVALGRAAGDADADVFLKQAAVFHSDVAAYGERPSAASSVDVSPRRQALRFGETVPPLLTANRLILGQDGQPAGEALASWNWPFARSLLDLVGTGVAGSTLRGAPRPENAKDPFVGAWYHATTAYMFANGLFGDAMPHLHDAARLLPADARILFDRGCYAELLGLPMHQEMLSASDIIEQRSRASGQGRGPQWGAPGSTPSLNIPLAETTNADAERLYRRALAIDPSLIEARVRLARLLDLRKQYNDAARELKTALAGGPAGVVGFHAHLFAGRTAQASGQPGEAMVHYKAARSLFPDAQSALLALSQLSLLGADVPEALAPLERLGGRSEVFTADPWWQYYLCAGRQADDLLTSLWAAVPR